MRDLDDLLINIASLTDEIESGRGLPDELVSSLKSSGVFRNLIPKQNNTRRIIN